MGMYNTSILRMKPDEPIVGRPKIKMLLTQYTIPTLKRKRNCSAENHCFVRYNCASGQAHFLEQRRAEKKCSKSALKKMLRLHPLSSHSITCYGEVYNSYVARVFVLYIE